MTLKKTKTYFISLNELEEREATGEPTATSTLLEAYKALPPMALPHWRALGTEWHFALGNPQEGLNTTLSDLPQSLEPIDIPHRTLDPDTPYWYVAMVTISEPSVLDIGADDGAQLYCDGRRIPIQGDTFLVNGSPMPIRMVVRVLNKAVYGGLEWVNIVPQPEFQYCSAALLRRAALGRLVRKTRLLRQPTKRHLSAVLNAVREGADSTLQKAVTQLANYPLTQVVPLLQNTTTHSTSILWETDVACSGRLEWGEGESVSSNLDAQSEGNLHSIVLTGLKPNTAYSYRTYSGCVVSRQYTFRTLPTEGGFAFTYWADPHCSESSNNDNSAFRQTVNALQQFPSAFTVGGGDFVEDGNHHDAWLSFFDILAPISAQVPTMLMGGNHEYDRCFEDLRSIYLERYLRNHPQPLYYAWTASNARFVALDPNVYFPTGIPQGSAEHLWFMQELESWEWRQAEWRFILIHQPPYSQGWLDYQGDIPIRNLLEPLIEKHAIDFVVSGHTHDYERLTRQYGKQTAHFLILGGAGGSIEEGALSPQPVMDRVIRHGHFGHFQVEADSVIFSAIATDARVLDTLKVSK